MPGDYFDACPDCGNNSLTTAPASALSDFLSRSIFISILKK